MTGLLTLAALAAHPERYQLIDVRDAQDHATAEVEGSVHIPLAELTPRLGEISLDLIPVTVCGKGGGCSAEGADLLVALGREGALAREGGTLGWLAARAWCRHGQRVTDGCPERGNDWSHHPIHLAKKPSSPRSFLI